MGRHVTKAAGNRYYKARIRASKYNQKLLTRAGAVEALPGITEESLKRYELGLTRPPDDVVGLMAKAYYAPELRNWRCSACPVGADCREIPEMPAERALVRLQNTLPDVGEAAREIARIMDDGIISAEEQEQLPRIRGRLLEFRRRADENLAVLERAARLGIF